MQLVQLQNDLQVLKTAGFGVAAISYDSTAVLADFAKRKSITFPLLSDHESVEIRAFHVADPQYRKGMQLDVDTEKVYNNTLGFVPVFGLSVPAVFVLTRDHHIKWRFVSDGPELRLTGAAILDESVSGTADEVRTLVPSKHVQVTASASNSTAGPGNRIVIGLELKIPKGFHVYSPDVGGDYKGVSWTMDDTQCFDTADAMYPKAEVKLMKSTNETLPVYENTLRITREIIVRPVIRANDPSIFKKYCALCVDPTTHISLTGTLKYQACDDKLCFPPQTVHPKWTFRFLYPDMHRSPGELWRELEQ
ncbi:MAG TPA: protein-disulfide reductase DsbD domain-containing protein [Bryobacteraceae bacterium]|jgi:peroxiredoxin